MKRKTPWGRSINNDLALKKWHQNKGQLFGVLGLLVVTFLLFSPALDNSFTNFDDQLYVTDNPIIYGLDSEHLGLIITKPVAGNYHPITMLTLAVNYQISALDASSYVWMNVLLHLLNTFLTFLFLYLLFKRNYWIGFIGAALFAVHPMHVESVVWVSERKDVLYTVFFLGGLISYLKYIKNKNGWTLAGVFLLFGVSVLSKPAAVVFPLILLLVDFFKGRNLLNARVITEKLPFFALSVIIGLLTINAQKDEAIGTFDNYAFFERLLFAAYGWVIYLVKLFVPFQLSAMHPYPNLEEGMPAIFYLAPVIILALFGWAVWYRKRSMVPLVGLLFYTLNLLLVLQFVSVGRAIIAERYTYVPYLGIFMIVGWAIRELQKHYGIKNVIAQSSVGAMVIWSLVLSFVTFERVEVWENSLTLWTDAAEKYPEDWFPFLGMGNYYKDNYQYQEALTFYDQAIQNKPDKASLYDSRGNIYRKLGQYNAAMADYNKALALDPSDPATYSDRGSLFFDLGQDEKALKDFNTALQLKPDLYVTYSNIGSVYGRQQNFDQAIQYFTNSLEINPAYADAYLYRGMAYGMQQHYQQALQDINYYLRYAIEPSTKGYYWRGMAQQALGNQNKALQDYNIVIQMEPGNGEYYLKRSEVLAALGQKQQALQDAQQAKQLGARVSEAYLSGLRQ